MVTNIPDRKVVTAGMVTVTMFWLIVVAKGLLARLIIIGELLNLFNIPTESASSGYLYLPIVVPALRP
jgi:hypothetical protein